MSDQISVATADGVCEIQLNRPEKRNAITQAMYAALIDALNEARADESVRVVLVSGAGASFTAGNDLKDFLSAGELGDENQAVRFLRLLPTFRKVLIAAVHGQTVGIGVTLLLHCDLVVAARSTLLSMPFVKLGLVPEAASSLLLPRAIGHHRAAELLLLGTPVDAAAAQSLGLVNRVVEDEALMEEARKLARAVAAQPPSALLATKRLLRSEVGSVSGRIEEELEAFRTQLGSAEFKAAAQAFFGKGRPG
ncbi:MAG TPA: enoyl-CoA hydratase [Steroidobacteraceae bacterium]|nr:enoyl-CoA hydratase [Steroidobacteraceae bacterium]